MTKRAATYHGNPCANGHAGRRYRSNGRCVECQEISSQKWRKQNPDKYRAINTNRFRNWRKKYPEQARLQQKKIRLKQYYGITLEQYQVMLAQQNHRCKCCGVNLLELPNKQIHIDHCHSTKKIRGILCHHCNTGLGAFEDNPGLLNRAVKYLRDNS